MWVWAPHQCRCSHDVSHVLQFASELLCSAAEANRCSWWILSALLPAVGLHPFRRVQPMLHPWACGCAGSYCAAAIINCLL